MEKVNTNYEMSDRFQGLDILLKLSGISVFDDSKSWIYRIYCLVILGCFYTMLVTAIAEMILKADDLEYLIENLRNSFAMIDVLWLHTSISLKKKRIAKLFRLTDNFTWSELPTRDPNSGSLTMAGWIPRIQTMAWKALLFILTGHCVNVTFRIVSRGGRSLSVNAWFPFDAKQSPAYEVILISQYVAAFVFANSMIAFSTIFMTLVAVACSQLDKLQAALLDIRQGREGSDMQRQIAQCVQLHQLIIRYMRELEDTFHVVMIGPFLMAMISLCFASFSIVVSWGEVLPIWQTLMQVASFLLQLQSFCWFGNELTDKAEGVRDAAWSCDWVGASVPFQRSVSFVIAASEDFTLTAGKMVPVSRRSMMLLLNEAFSYFMFLKSFKEDSTEGN